jgi:hypothetical protein
VKTRPKRVVAAERPRRVEARRTRRVVEEEMTFEADDLSSMTFEPDDLSEEITLDVTESEPEALPAEAQAALELTIPDMPADVAVAATAPVNDRGMRWNAQLVSWANYSVAKQTERSSYEGVGRIDVGLSSLLGSSFAATANGRFRYGYDMLETQNVSTYQIEPREIYLSYRADRLSLTVGNQVVRWGVTDFFNPNDVVNPVDFRDRTAANPDSPQIPVPAIRAQYSFEHATIEAVALPMFMAHRQAGFGNRWGFFAGQKALNQAVDLVETETGPGVAGQFEDVFSQKTAPKLSPENVSGGARVAFQLGRFDLHLNGFYGFDRNPIIRLDPAMAIVTAAFEDNGENINMTALEPTLADIRQSRMTGTPLVIGTPERTIWAGTDFTFTFDKVVFKGDVTGSPAETVYTTGSIGKRLPTVSAAAGFDYTPIQDLTITVEGFGRFLLRPLPDEEDSRFGTGEDVVTAAAARYAPQGGKLSVQVGGTYSILRRDFRLQPRLTYQVLPALSMAVGGSVMGGPANSYGGAYGENDHVFLRFDWLAL